MRKNIVEKKKRRRERISQIFIGIILGSGILLMLSLFLGAQNSEVMIASASTSMREEVEAEDYEDLTYSTVNEALTEANGQLTVMNTGDIYTINENDNEFTARLFMDYLRGGVLYWELGDSGTTIFIDAYSGEIYHYIHYSEWSEGEIDQEDAEEQAEIISMQFADLPKDLTRPETDFKVLYKSIGMDPVSLEFTGNVTKDYWCVIFYRVKDDIVADDHIRLYLDPTGNLHSYEKVWNMDLTDVCTTYTVTQESAESTALTCAGEGSISETTEKMIMRPDYFWTEGENGRIFGEEPVCIWSVYVEDSDHNLRMYYIHGTSGNIVGGDFASFYYGSDIEEES